MKFRDIFFIAGACLGLFASVARAENLEEYSKLALELSTFPLTLISAEGEMYSSSSEGMRGEARQFIVRDQANKLIGLPEAATLYAVPEQPGGYLVRGRVAGQTTVWNAVLTDGELRLGQSVTSVPNESAVIALGHGIFAAHRLDRNTDGYIYFYDVDRNVEPVKLAIGYNARAIGTVIHPVSGEVGIAISPWSNSNHVDLYFASSKEIKIQFPPVVSVFDASDRGILVGVRRRICENDPGSPEGLCSPDLFIVTPPKQDAQYQREDIATFRHVAIQVPNVTFGFDNPLKTDTDFKMVGDRLLVIARRGPQQEVLEFSLLQRIDPVVRMPMEDGIELQFGVASGPIGKETVTVTSRSYLRPLKTMGIQMGSGDVKLASEGKPFQRIEALDLAVKTVSTRVTEGLPPFTLVGKRSSVENGVCAGGPALIEAYGASRVPLDPFNVLGLVPSLFDHEGVYVAAHIGGSGGFGQPWGQRGNYAEAPRQIEEMVNLIDELRRKGCNEIIVTGQSFGGNVALRAGLLHPGKVDRIIAAITPLDISKEFAVGNRAISALLPRDWSNVGAAEIAAVSPRALALQATDLSSLSITLIQGEFDDQISTGKDESSIQAMREKGAKVRLIVQPGLGHSRFVTPEQWSQYWFNVGQALAD